MIQNATPAANNKTAMQSEYCIAAYTRNPSAEYSAFLAQSVHFAVSVDAGNSFVPLYHNYGKLFAKCDFNEENGIVSKGVHDIAVYKIDGGYIITGRELRRTNLGNGNFTESDTGKYVRWTTNDFAAFSGPEIRDTMLTEEEQAKCDETAAAIAGGVLDYSDAVSISISREIAEKLIQNNKTVECKSVELPETVTIHNKEELENVTATVRYTDGSTHNKHIKWNLDGIDFTKAGEYTVKGEIIVRHFPFPVEEHPWADPVITYYNGKYYFIATDDADGNKTFKVREADTPEKLFTADARRSVILSAADGVFEGTFWAPEFHITGGKMRIFCALSKKVFDPQCHVMTLKDGGDILNPDDWSAPQRCIMPDGRYLNINPLGDGKNGITLDMTYLETNGKSYVVWSYRTWEGTDSGSMLMVAEVDPDEPWKLLTYPQLLTRPVYGWEHIEGTDNNEGPYAIVTRDKVYLAYSGGDARGHTYVIGLLTANAGDDLCNPASWEASLAPALASDFVKGEYGCGHNAFFTDEYGDLYITYHGCKTRVRNGIRPGIRRVHFTMDGTPLLFMTNEQDLPESQRNVSITINVKPS